MKRLLCILSSMDAGGAETFLMKIYRKIDKTQYQMDFCINVKERCFHEDEINSYGGKIYRIPTKTENIREFKKQLTDIVRQGKYQYVLRITSNAMGFMDLKIAKKAGASVCTARSSNSSDGGGVKLLLAHHIGRLLYSRYVDVRIAPSDLAAQYTFGMKTYNTGKVTLLRNGLDPDFYTYDLNARKNIRQEYNISENAFVVGHVGRFDEQKNHDFLIEVFKEIKKIKSDAVLLLVGIGSHMEHIKQRVETEKIKDVIFAGLRADIPGMLSAMDVFVFPSIYEGMPNTVIEAQATGLPCIISSSITKEVNISDNVCFIDLSESAEIWAHKVIESNITERKSGKDLLIEKHYDIDSVTKEFVRLVFKEGT